MFLMYFGPHIEILFKKKIFKKLLGIETDPDPQNCSKTHNTFNYNFYMEDDFIHGDEIPDFLCTQG
jgi:hypothetical protein